MDDGVHRLKSDHLYHKSKTCDIIMEETCPVICWHFTLTISSLIFKVPYKPKHVFEEKKTGLESHELKKVPMCL